MAGPTTAERGGRRTRRPSGPGGPAPGGPPARPGGRRRLPGPRAVLLTVAVLALLVGAAWMLYGSKWLRVQQVTASGTRVLSPEQVTSAAAVPLGDPLVSVDTDGIEDRLRRALPRIDTVEAVRSWPDGIVLKVTERKAVLLLPKGAAFTEVDAEGVRFATVGKAPVGVPLLDLEVDRSPSLRRFGTERLTGEAVGVAAGLPERIAREVRVVRVRSYDSITLELNGGRTVVWGSGEQGEAKARALTALMKAAPKAGHFDVSAPTAPAASRS